MASKVYDHTQDHPKSKARPIKRNKNMREIPPGTVPYMSNGAHGDWFVTCFFTNEKALLKRPASARRTVDGSNTQLKL